MECRMMVNPYHLTEGGGRGGDGGWVLRGTGTGMGWKESELGCTHGGGGGGFVGGGGEERRRWDGAG